MGLFDFLKKNKNIENDNGLNETYRDNGRGVLREKFYRKNGKIDGLYQFYSTTFLYEVHFLEEEGNFKNGKEDGIWKVYWSDGKTLKEEGNFKNGKKDGIWKKYNMDRSDINSGLTREENYKEGKLHGTSKFISTFEIKFTSMTLGSKLDRKTQTTKIENYKNGVLDGLQKEYEFVRYDKNEIIFGDLIGETYFENGEERRNN